MLLYGLKVAMDEHSPSKVAPAGGKMKAFQLVTCAIEKIKTFDYQKWQMSHLFFYLINQLLSHLNSYLI